MKHELQILTIDGAYGGDQHWFRHPMMRLGGCSTVCACHLAAELALRFGKTALYPYETEIITKAQFRKFAKTMYRYVYPGRRGMPETGMFEAGFSAYAASTGETVRYETLSGEADAAAAEAFIRAAVDGGRSVQYLLLEHCAPDVDDIEWHWFTVTGYDDADGFDIIFSTWGERRQENLAKLWETGKEERGGLLTAF